MELINWMAVVVAAIVPMIVGFLWYNEKTLGGAWMRETGLNQDSMKGANMPMIFGVSFIFAIMLAISLNPIVIHQMALSSIVNHQLMGTDEAAKAAAQADVASIMNKYGTEFRTFKHGAFHGLITTLFFVLPVLGTNALFERKSWKYIWINVGYWAVSLMLMGGIICAWAK